jgi:hypothetical protein
LQSAARAQLMDKILLGDKKKTVEESEKDEVREREARALWHSLMLINPHNNRLFLFSFSVLRVSGAARRTNRRRRVCCCLNHRK